MDVYCPYSPRGISGSTRPKRSVALGGSGRVERSEVRAEDPEHVAHLGRVVRCPQDARRSMRERLDVPGLVDERRHRRDELASLLILVVPESQGDPSRGDEGEE